MLNDFQVIRVRSDCRIRSRVRLFQRAHPERLGAAHAWVVSALFGLCLALAGGPALAWQPARFEVFCGSPAADSDETQAWYAARLSGNPDQAYGSPCLTPERAQLVAEYATIALKAFAPLGFKSPAPHRLGPIVLDGSGKQAVRLYVDNQYKGIANARSPCNRKDPPLDPDRLSYLTFSPGNLDNLPNPTILRYIAHEIVHVVQNAQPLVNDASTDRCADIPAWLFEGSADALGLYVSKRRFPTYQPPLNVRGAKSYYGLRPYNKAFTWDSDRNERDRYGQVVASGYRTHSFFMHLADHYQDGRYDYLARFFATPDLTVGDDDWLLWLDAVMKDPKNGIKTPLYLAFPDFMANFSNWGQDKYPHIGKDDWLGEAFDGCQTITLSPGQPTQAISLELEPISAQCLRVLASGIKPNELAHVKFMVQADSEEAVDNLHLAVSRMSGRVPDAPEMEKGCHVAARKHPGKPVCVTKPFTGRKGASDDMSTREKQHDGTWVKTWLTLAQETNSDPIDNLYMLVHTPVRPSDQRHANRDRQKVDLVIGLERHQLATATHGNAGRVIASVNNHRTEPVPMSPSEPVQSSQAVQGFEAMSKLPFLMNTVRIPKTHGPGISTLTVSDTRHVAGADPEPTITLTLTVAEGTIPFGATGRFKAHVLLSDEPGMRRIEKLDMGTASTPAGAEALGRAIAGLAGAASGGNTQGDEPSATIEVITFDNHLLHLRASGQYCLTRDYDRQRACLQPKNFHAEIIKPFGWTYDNAQEFISVDTPGMEIYRRFLYQQMRALPGMTLPPPPGPDDSLPDNGSKPPAGGQPGAQGCDCSCDAYTQSRKILKAQKQNQRAAMPSPDLLNIMSCSLQCMQSWSRCKRR